MQLGDLVEIRRFGIGVPKGTLALLLDMKLSIENPNIVIATVLPIGLKKTVRRRYLLTDLKIYQQCK